MPFLALASYQDTLTEAMTHSQLSPLQARTVLARIVLSSISPSRIHSVPGLAIQPWIDWIQDDIADPDTPGACLEGIILFWNRDGVRLLSFLSSLGVSSV